MGTERAFQIQMSRVRSVLDGNDGNATKALYEKLTALGPAGDVATNAFRALKTSAAAKRYRGGNGQGSYRSQAYARKNWSIDNLAKVLAVHGPALGVRFGWGIDAALAATDSPHRHVFYIDLPTGQVSFHCEARLGGPDYAGHWDGARGVSPDRICRWCAHLLSGYPVQAAPACERSAPIEQKQEGLF